MEQSLAFDWQSLQILLSLCLEFKERIGTLSNEELREYVMSLGQLFGIEDIDAFAAAQVGKVVGREFANVMDPEGAEAVAAIVAGACKPVMELALKVARNGMKPQDFFLELNKICFGNVEELTVALQQALGITDEVARFISEKLGPYTVSVYCFAAAYKIYAGAARDAALAREHRIEIERLCNESIAALKARRAEMEELVSTYMLARIPVFSESVVAMDQAILENDDDGFIAANAELWELFGRDAQYRTAKEFDDLMLSDETFTL